MSAMMPDLSQVLIPLHETPCGMCGLPAAFLDTSARAVIHTDRSACRAVAPSHTYDVPESPEEGHSDAAGQAASL